MEVDVRVGALGELAHREPVSRTPHIGNLYPADLALLSLGVPTRLVDKNCSRIDGVYAPEARIVGAREIQLSDQAHTLSPYLITRDGRPLAYDHFHAVARAFSRVLVSTYSTVYLKHIDVVEETLAILAKSAADVFNRLVTSDGRVARLVSSDADGSAYRDPLGKIVRVRRDSLVRRCIDYFERSAACAVEGVPMQTGGHLLISAQADLLLQGVLDALETGGDRNRTIYQCSGIAMARYATNPRLGYSDSISRLYVEVRRRGSRVLAMLPDITLLLIPTSMLRLVFLDADRYSRHRQILDCDERRLILKRKKAEEIKDARTDRERRIVIDRYQVLFGQVNERQQSLIAEQAAGKFSPFYALGDSSRFTQYDLVGSDAKIEVPADVLDLPIKHLAPRMKKLLAAYPQLRSEIFV